MFSTKNPTKSAHPAEDPIQTISKADAEAQIQKLKRHLETIEEADKLKKRSSNVLVPASPSPRKKKRTCNENIPSVKVSGQTDSQPNTSTKALDRPPESDAENSGIATEVILPSRPKSTLLVGLQAVRDTLKTNATVRTIPRNTSFLDTHPLRTKSISTRLSLPGSSRTGALTTERAAPSHTTNITATKVRDPHGADPPDGLRAADLTIRTEIPMGPISFQAPLGDPQFTKLEPNSNVRLKQRKLSHPDLQDHLYGRYMVRINQLYSIVRKLDNGRSKGGTEWDIPLVGDWVLFAVIGEKGDFKLTNPSNQSFDPKSSLKSDQPKNPSESAGNHDDLTESLRQDDEAQQSIHATEFSQQARPRKRKHFVNLKLIDMSSKTISRSGSGFLNMLLFEAEEEILTKTVNGDGVPVSKKTYRGGSGGAYEKFWKEQPGTLMAILNPKVLKSRSYGTSGNSSSILSITPETADSVIVIGRAKDLGNCTARRLDTGKECGNWCDMRYLGGPDDENETKSLAICEYHLQRQVSKARAGRAELFVSTSGMKQHVGTKFNATSMRKIGSNQRSQDYDPAKKTGLLPASSSKQMINGQMTYICQGDRNSSADSKTHGKKQRWAQAIDAERLDAMKRRRKQQLADAELDKLLQQERGTDGTTTKHSVGGQYLLDAQRLLRDKKEIKHQASSNASNSSCGVTKAPSKPRQSFNATLIQAIGHDPTSKNPSTSASRPGSPTETTNQSEAYLDLLGEDRPVRTSAPDDLNSEAKQGARHKRGPRVTKAMGPPRSMIGTLVESGHDADQTRKMKENESDSDDSLIVLPP